MTGFLTSIWQRIVAAISGEAQPIENALSATEQAVLQESDLFFKQVESTLGTDGVSLVKTLLQAALASMATGGGDLSAVITGVVEKALAGVATDLIADAKNAVYGLIAILLPNLQAQQAAAKA